MGTARASPGKPGLQLRTPQPKIGQLRRNLEGGDYTRRNTAFSGKEYELYSAFRVELVILRSQIQKIRLRRNFQCRICPCEVTNLKMFSCGANFHIKLPCIVLNYKKNRLWREVFGSIAMQSKNCLALDHQLRTRSQFARAGIWSMPTYGTDQLTD